MIVVMYITLFGKICMSFADKIEADEKSFFITMIKSKLFYCLFLYFLLLPNILKKRIHELKFTSVLLFGGVISMVLIFAVRVFFYGNTLNKKSEKMEEYVHGNIIDSIAIVVTSYGFILNLFPVYTSMDNRSNSKGFSATIIALTFCFVIYIFFSILAYYTYGSSLNPDLFQNIQLEDSISSIFIRALFLLIFLCNIPYLFLPGKEAFLIMVDEFKTKSMSMQIMKHMSQMDN